MDIHGVFSETIPMPRLTVLTPASPNYALGATRETALRRDGFRFLRGVFVSDQAFRCTIRQWGTDDNVAPMISQWDALPDPFDPAILRLEIDWPFACRSWGITLTLTALAPMTFLRRSLEMVP